MMATTTATVTKLRGNALLLLPAVSSYRSLIIAQLRERYIVLQMQDYYFNSNNSYSRSSTFSTGTTTTTPTTNTSTSISTATTIKAAEAAVATTTTSTTEATGALQRGVPSFFTYNSGRARRKRKLRLLQAKLLEQKKASNKSNDDDSNIYYYESENDTRTVMDILFPNPFKGMSNPYKTNWPTSFQRWKEVFTLAWRDYKETWEGFSTRKGMLEDDNNNDDDNVSKSKALSKTTSNDDKDDFETTTKEIMQNVRRNRRFVQTAANKIREEVRTRTGITSVEDIKQFAADAMRLMTECLQQFMSGYRKGRDDEVEKMLTEYFQDLETKANQPPPKIRRKIKRRVLNRYHPLN